MNAMEGKKKEWEAEQQMRNIESGVGHIDVAKGLKSQKELVLYKLTGSQWS